MRQWFEEMTFRYVNADGDVVSSSIIREGGINRNDAYDAFEQFLRGAGYSVSSDDEPDEPIERTLDAEYDHRTQERH